MSNACIHSRAASDINSPPVTVEVHVSRGMPQLSIVGLPEAAVKESKDRVRSAILNSNFDFPRRRVTINLAPADLPKEGGCFDLPIALGILSASDQLKSARLNDYEFIGELSLNGDIRKTRGVLAVAMACRSQQRTLIVPTGALEEACLVPNLKVMGANTLVAVAKHFNACQSLVEHDSTSITKITDNPLDLADVKGQQFAKRGLEVALAGGHNLLFIGPPGAGKSMLAERASGILPALTIEEALETAAVYSLSQDGFDTANWRQRPFRSPHHSASGTALVGGGSHPMPGEISLAHNGILFLDELPEFNRHSLELLREPMESGTIAISRIARQVRFPADFQLLAAMNPCPCGYTGDSSGRCRCTPRMVQQYRSKISGPLLDRIDIHILLPRLTWRDLQQPTDAQCSAEVRNRVSHAHARQRSRQGCLNSSLPIKSLKTICRLSAKTEKLLHSALNRLTLSARAYHRILRVARTIADLERCTTITSDHLAEAIQFRYLDRERHLQSQDTS